MIRAVLFDVGGVLHTNEDDEAREQDFAETALKILKDAGIDPGLGPREFTALVDRRAGEYKKYSEEHQKELGGALIWSEFFLKDLSLSPEKLAPCAEKLCYVFVALRKRIIPRPHLLETVEALHDQGMKLGVVSNIISTTFVPERLEHYGIAPYMECVVTSCETGIRKPAARIFRIAADRLKTPVGECAYVGDRISRDVIGSRNAGIGFVILIRHPPSEQKDAALVCPENEPNCRIDDLAEIPAIIAKLNEGESCSRP